MLQKSVSGPRLRRLPPPGNDLFLLGAMAALLVLGAVMVYSASVSLGQGATTAAREDIFLRHVAATLVAVAAGTAASRLSMQFWQKHAFFCFFFGVGLLALVLVVGKEANGARRWFALGPLTFQPAEMVKLLAILYAADFCARKKEVLHKVGKGLLPMAAVLVLVGALLLLEPDFGSFVSIALVVLAVMFCAGMRMGPFLVLGVLGILAFAALIISSPYRMQRMMAFLDPFGDPYGEGYQLTHALIAFGRGGITGVGLGASVEKLHYLPEAHTDFIFAVLAEELGLLGVLVVMGIYFALSLRLFRAGTRAAVRKQWFSSFFAHGVGVWFSLQTIINMGVTMGVLPTKGLTMPLMSYGGSANLAIICALMLVARVELENRRFERGYPPCKNW